MAENKKGEISLKYVSHREIVRTIFDSQYGGYQSPLNLQTRKNA